MAAALEMTEAGSQFQSLLSLKSDIPGQMATEQSEPVASGEAVKKAPVMMRPGNLQELDANLMRWPQARLCAGGTDLLLEKTQQGKPLDCLVSCLEVKEMTACSTTEKALLIGAAASYSVIEQYCQLIWPDLGQFLKRFGSPQIRNRATLGGNLATASPVGDMSPLLMVMNASVIVRSVQGVERSIAVGEFFNGYRQTVLNDGEYIRAVSIGLEAFKGFRRFFKNSKRTMDDISTVMGAFYLDVSSSRVREARIAYGGLAAIPIRVKVVEDFLVGKELSQACISRAQTLLQGDINPLSDVRASADYRSHIAASMLSRALREQSGEILPAVTVG
jgi:xanthine dehydrogenase small subunit